MKIWALWVQNELPTTAVVAEEGPDPAGALSCYFLSQENSRKGTTEGYRFIYYINKYNKSGNTEYFTYLDSFED